MLKIKVGITIGLQHAAEPLWNNGIKQNAVFLAETLKNCPSVETVRLVNTTDILITEQLPWDLNRWPTISFEQAKDELDLLIELGGQINSEQTAYLKNRGCRLVSYCCGFEYVHAIESILFSKPSFGFNLFINQRYDAVWMIPQVAPISGSYFQTLRRTPAQVVPFVWSPIFLETNTKGMKNQGRYTPRSGKRRLTVMEPNINVVKFCLYPILLAEEAYRQRPDLIDKLQVTNSDKIAQGSKEFIALMNQLDIVREHKAIFLGRHETPKFLSEMTDIVISHQWENALNYFYLEVAWQGYPLVHNADMCKELGYYYPGNDIFNGTEKLLFALEHHDAECEAYIDSQRLHIKRFLPNHPEVIECYAKLLHDLTLKPIK